MHTNYTLTQFSCNLNFNLLFFSKCFIFSKLNIYHKYKYIISRISVKFYLDSFIHYNYVLPLTLVFFGQVEVGHLIFFVVFNNKVLYSMTFFFIELCAFYFSVMFCLFFPLIQLFFGKII